MSSTQVRAERTEKSAKHRNLVLIAKSAALLASKLNADSDLKQLSLRDIKAVASETKTVCKYKDMELAAENLTKQLEPYGLKISLTGNLIKSLIKVSSDLKVKINTLKHDIDKMGIELKKLAGSGTVKHSEDELRSISHNVNEVLKKRGIDLELKYEKGKFEESYKDLKIKLLEKVVTNESRTALENAEPTNIAYTLLSAEFGDDEKIKRIKELELHHVKMSNELAELKFKLNKMTTELEVEKAKNQIYQQCFSHFKVETQNEKPIVTEEQVKEEKKESVVVKDEVKKIESVVAKESVVVDNGDEQKEDKTTEG